MSPRLPWRLTARLLRSKRDKLNKKLASLKVAADDVSRRIAECQEGLASPEPVGWFPMNDSPVGSPMYHEDYSRLLNSYSKELIHLRAEIALLEAAAEASATALIDLCRVHSWNSRVGTDVTCRRCGAVRCTNCGGRGIVLVRSEGCNLCDLAVSYQGEPHYVVASLDGLYFSPCPNGCGNRQCTACGGSGTLRKRMTAMLAEQAAGAVVPPNLALHRTTDVAGELIPVGR